MRNNRKYEEKLDAFRLSFIGMMVILAISTVMSICEAQAHANDVTEIKVERKTNY